MPDSDQVVRWEASLERMVDELWTLAQPSAIAHDEMVLQLSAAHTEIERFCIDVCEEAESIFVPDRTNATLRHFWIVHHRLAERIAEGPGRRQRAIYHLDSALISLTLVDIFAKLLTEA